jgi:dihydrofolate reductase
MRKLISGIFITLDGVVEAPHAWNPPYYNDEMTDVVQALLAASDTHLYGRRSYEMFHSVFTGAAANRIAHAPTMNETPKVLVSSTITAPDWGPTTLITGDVAAKIHALKQQPGKNINVQASGTLVRFLLENGLLDELHLLVHPVVVGTGTHLFEDGNHPVPLQLLDSMPFATGVIYERLAPVEPPASTTAAARDRRDQPTSNSTSD